MLAALICDIAPEMPRAAGTGDFCGSAGSFSVKHVPLPIELSTRILPPWASMMFLQVANPSPVPPLPLSSGPALVVKYGSKIFRIVSSVMPVP